MKGCEPILSQLTNQMEELKVLDRIEILKGYSQDFVGRVPIINLLFIDGDHSQDGAEFDFLNYAPAISRGGYILFHGYDASRKNLGPT